MARSKWVKVLKVIKNVQKGLDLGGKATNALQSKTTKKGK